MKQPWITPRLIELIKDKDKALKIAKKILIYGLRLKDYLTPALTDLGKSNLILIKNKLQLIRKTKRNFGNIFRMFYQISYIVTGSPHCLMIIIKLLMLKTQLTLLITFFTDIGPNLAKDCQLAWEYPGRTCERSILNIHTTTEEITEICRNININKASCIDNVSSEILKDVFLTVPEKVCIFFNAATMPDTWKYAKVSPIPKGGDCQLVSNYRPISLLPLLSKMMEKSCTYVTI